MVRVIWVCFFKIITNSSLSYIEITRKCKSTKKTRVKKHQITRKIKSPKNPSYHFCDDVIKFLRKIFLVLVQPILELWYVLCLYLRRKIGQNVFFRVFETIRFLNSKNGRSNWTSKTLELERFFKSLERIFG